MSNIQQPDNVIPATPNLTIDEVPNEAILNSFLKHNPSIKREVLKDYDVETRVKKFRTKDGKFIGRPCLYFPLYDIKNDSEIELVNRLIIPADKELTYEIPYYYEEPQERGILCTKHFFDDISNNSTQQSGILFCDKLKDMFLLAGTAKKISVEGSRLFSIFSPDGKVYGNEESPVYDMDDKDYSLSQCCDAAAYKMLKFAKKSGSSFGVLANEQNSESQRCKDMLYMASVNFQKEYRFYRLPPPFSESSIDEYIAQGGTLDGILAWNQMVNFAWPPKEAHLGSEYDMTKGCLVPKIPKKDDYNPHRGVRALQKLMNSFVEPEEKQCYPCADEGSLLYQLSPEKGTLTLIGGAPGVGKTALGMQIVNETLFRNSNVENILVVNTDQSPVDLLRREISRTCNISLNEVRNNQVFAKTEHHHSLFQSFPKMKQLAEKVHFIGEPPIEIEDIENYVYEVNPEVLVIDHINEIRVGERPKINDRERINHVVTSLRGFASQGIAVIVMCALNRVGTRRSKYSPLGFSDLRGSSSLEYSATKIWCLRQLKKNSGHTHILEGLKSKESLQANIPLNFDGSRMQFTVAELPAEKTAKAKPSKKSKPKSSPKTDVDDDGGMFAK